MNTNNNRPSEIENVNVIEQKGVRIYTFALSAIQLLSLGRVERFGEDRDGVNRQLNETHALEIAEAMVDPSLLWLEPFLGDLRGSWVYDVTTHTMRVGHDAYFSIDDGQHRRRAVEVLNQAEQERLTFNVTATKGLTREQRIKIFRMQAERRQIDARLDLAQRYELGQWASHLDEEAYKILLALNSDDDSVIKGQIILTERLIKPYEGRHRPTGINGKGLFNTVRLMINSRSPLHALSPEKRLEVMKNMLRAASEVWKKQWRSETHMLTTARGINSVMLAMVRSPNFRGAIGDDFRYTSLKDALTLASTFDWSSSKRRNDPLATLVDALNNAIGRGNQTKKAKAS